MKIKINLVTDVYEFVNICSHFIGEITVTQGRHCINAKSILGIFSLDLSSEIDVSIDTNDEEKAEFYKLINKWEVEA